MNRLGWAILVVILVIGGGFLLLIGGGHPLGSPAPAPSAAAPVAEASGPLTIPVVGIAPTQLVDTFDQDRADGARAHHALDIMASRGTQVVAAAPGTVEKLFDSKDGGHTVYIRSPDRRWSHYYAHLDGYAPSLAEGAEVIRGQLIGFVGDSGNAGAGNTHLHFAVYRTAPDAPWYKGEPVDPYPLLAGSAAAR